MMTMIMMVIMMTKMMIVPVVVVGMGVAGEVETALLHKSRLAT